MKYLAYILAPVLLLASCTGSNKTVAGKNDNHNPRKKMACADVHIDMNTPHLDWVIESNNVLNKADYVLVLPKEYYTYSIDSAQLVTFFRAVNNGETLKTVIPLPKPAGCQVFTVHNNLPESANIAGAFTITGDAMGQKLMAGYGNGNFVAQVNWFDINYEIMTVTVQGAPYFIVYAKQPPAENKNIDRNPANTMPQIQEIRYDK